MDSLAYPIFSLVSGLVRYSFNEIMDAAYLRFVASVAIIAIGIETLQFIYFGYLIMFGHTVNVAMGRPTFQKLMYRAGLVAFMMHIIKTDQTPLDLLLAFRALLLEGLTGDIKPAGEQAAFGLMLMDEAFASTNIVNSITQTADTSAINTTAINLSLMAQVAPQISAGVMLLMNEMLVRVGMALCPLMVYAALYECTRNMFIQWFQYMLGFTIQMGALALVTVLAAGVTGVFNTLFNGAVLANHQSAVIGSYYISHLQQSVMQAGLGVTLLCILIWFPSNAGCFGGTVLYAKTTKSGLGHRSSSLTAKFVR
jgi:TrbL/VirB6 plasmid conjugal transfer protein